MGVHCVSLFNWLLHLSIESKGCQDLFEMRLFRIRTGPFLALFQASWFAEAKGLKANRVGNACLKMVLEKKIASTNRQGRDRRESQENSCLHSMLGGPHPNSWYVGGERVACRPYVIVPEVPGTDLPILGSRTWCSSYPLCVLESSQGTCEQQLGQSRISTLALGCPRHWMESRWVDESSALGEPDLQPEDSGSKPQHFKEGMLKVKS